MDFTDPRVKTLFNSLLNWHQYHNGGRDSQCSSCSCPGGQHEPECFWKQIWELREQLGLNYD